MAKDKKEKEDKGFSWNKKKKEEEKEDVVAESVVAPPAAEPNTAPFSNTRPKRKMRGVRVMGGIGSSKRTG